jgi:hypothetical protein
MKFIWQLCRSYSVVANDSSTMSALTATTTPALKPFVHQPSPTFDSLGSVVMLVSGRNSETPNTGKQTGSDKC